MTRRIISVDHHRNGVAGVPFYVALVDDTEEGETRRMLVISFDDDSAAYTAALDVNQVARGNIFMHAAPDRPDMGGNAWRGDYYDDMRKEFAHLYSERMDKLLRDLADKKKED